MKQLLIVANWKSYKTTSEAKEWLETLESRIKNYELGNKTIILCPSFTLLQHCIWFVRQFKLPIILGAQDVSAFPEGPYTGEVNAKQIKEFCAYVIIGHSERRQNFQETEEILAKKVQQAKEAGLKVIFCVQGTETKIPEGVEIVAYEPVSAIGTGNPDTPENANTVAEYIKTNNSSVLQVLYGGSITSENVHAFSNVSAIDGVLIGGASLDSEAFAHIVENA